RWTKYSVASLLRAPSGRPLGLPDWPGLNWVNSLPVTCFPPVDSGLRLAISVHRIRFTGRSLHRTFSASHSPTSSASIWKQARPAFASDATLPDALDPQYRGDSDHRDSP